MSTTTILKSDPKIELSPEEWNPDGEFCVTDPVRPDFGLCGMPLEGPEMDDDEVPDEITCKECLAIQKALK